LIRSVGALPSCTAKSERPRAAPETACRAFSLSRNSSWHFLISQISRKLIDRHRWQELAKNRYGGGAPGIKDG